MSTTSRYSAPYNRLHRLLLVCARRHKIAPMDVRVLLAVHERGGAARTDELEADLLAQGSPLRRSIGQLRESGYVTGGGQAGVRGTIELTDPGRELVQDLERELLALEDDSAAGGATVNQPERTEA